MPDDHLRFEKLPTKWFVIGLGTFVIIFGGIAVMILTGYRGAIFPPNEDVIIENIKKCGDHCNAPWEALKIVGLIVTSALFIGGIPFFFYKLNELLKTKEQPTSDKRQGAPPNKEAGK